MTQNPVRPPPLRTSQPKAVDTGSPLQLSPDPAPLPSTVQALYPSAPARNRKAPFSPLSPPILTSSRSPTILPIRPVRPIRRSASSTQTTPTQSLPSPKTTNPPQSLNSRLRFSLFARSHKFIKRPTNIVSVCGRHVVDGFTAHVTNRRISTQIEKYADN
jgi:hypothetical protein